MAVCCSASREDILRTVERALAELVELVEPNFWTWRGCNSLAICLLSCIERMASAESPQEKLSVEQRFSLLKECERIMQTLQLKGVPPHTIRQLRFSTSQLWQEECAVAADQTLYVLS